MSDDLETKAHDKGQEVQLIGLDEFLENHPPGSQAFIRGIGKQSSGKVIDFLKPDLQLHCSSEECGGIRIFTCTKDSKYYIEQEWEPRFLTYVCRNCRKTTKTYALFARLNLGMSGEAYKIGEYPNFGPPLPSRLISMIGHERDLFLKELSANNMDNIWRP